MIRKKSKKHSRAKLRKRPRRNKKSKRQKPQKTEKKSSSIINVKTLMKKYSPGMQVSPSAVHAMIGRFDLFLEIAMPQIVGIAQAHGCKKIKECENLEHPEKSQVHVTWFFSMANNRIENIAKIKKSHHWELVRNGKNNEADNE